MALNVMSCKTPITVQIEPLRKLWCLFGLFDFPNGSPSCAFEPLQPRTSLLDARIPVRLCLVQCLKSIARLSFRRVTWEPAIPLRFKWRGLCSARTKKTTELMETNSSFCDFGKLLGHPFLKSILPQQTHLQIRTLRAAFTEIKSWLGPCRIASNIFKIKSIKLNVWSALFGFLVLASMLLWSVSAGLPAMSVAIAFLRIDFLFALGWQWAVERFLELSRAPLVALSLPIGSDRAHLSPVQHMEQHIELTARLCVTRHKLWGCLHIAFNSCLPSGCAA